MVPLFAAAALVIAALFLYVSSVRSSRDSDAQLLLGCGGRSSLDGESPWWERAVIARRMSIDAKICRVCGKPTTTQCGRCKSVKYCSIVCQRKDWGSNHKFECEHLQRNAAAAAAAAAASPHGHANGGASAWPAAKPPPPPDPNEDAPVPARVLFPYQHYLQLWHSRTSCRRPPVGLVNNGNTCYANAALQCLLATRPLRAYLDGGLHTISCNKPGSRAWCLLCELQALCRRLGDAGPGCEVSARPLLRHLRQLSKTLSPGRQEDAHEFFYSLLNTMEAIQLTNYGGKERYDVRSQETTLVHHVYGGYLRSQVVCGGCGAASRRYEAALDVTLEVPPGVARLEDALARHTAEEVLDGDNRYACDACRSRCAATRSTRFEVAPNSLVLCLKRFGTGRYGKINAPLVYGEALDLAPFMAAGAMDGGSVTYTLSSVVVHLDQMNSTSYGHYIAFVRAADGRWYGCDDGRVSPTSPSRATSQNAYMLFYSRDTPKPAPSPGYKRPAPLSPPTAAEAAQRKAGQQPEQQQQQRESGSDQQQPQQQAAAAGDAASGPAAGPAGQDEQQQEQQVQQQQPPQPPSLASAALLSRVSTAPAALVRLAEPSSSSSSRDDDEEDGSLAASSADADVSECSTPCESLARGAAGDAASWAPWRRSSLSGDSSSCAAGGDELPQDAGSAAASAGEGQEQQQVQGQGWTRQQQQQQGGAGDTGSAGQPAAAAASVQPPQQPLPVVSYAIQRSGPELLVLRAQLPGVASAADVAVDVVAGGGGLQRLQLRAPGRFRPLDIPLAGALGGQQLVRAVSGRLFRRRQMLRLCLHLDAAPAGAAAGPAGVVPLAWHSTDHDDSSSGSESDGLTVPPASLHEVMSEMDLSAFFGRHRQELLSSRAAAMMHGLQQHAAGEAATSAAGSDGGSGRGSGGSKGKPGGARRGSSGKKGKGRRK